MSTMEEQSDDILQETEPPQSEPIFEGWVREELYTLFTLLKIHGSHKIKEITVEIPSKSEEEVRSAIDYYKKRTIQAKGAMLPKCVSKPRKIHKPPQIPLAHWVKQLTDTLPYTDLQTETKNAIRFIANFEEFPPSKETEQVDFRKVYHQIADAMEGKSLSDDKLMIEVLNTCLIDSVLLSKAFINLNVLKFILKSINLENKDVVSGFNRPTKDSVLATLRYLISQRNYNPLNISEEYLTKSIQLNDES